MNKNKLKICIIRPEEYFNQSIKLANEIGFESYFIPIIITKEIEDIEFNNFKKDIYENNIDYIIFTSSNGIKYTLKKLDTIEKSRFIELLKNIKVICIGSQTKKELNSIGVQNILVPDEYSSLGILNLLKKENIKNKNIYIPRNYYGTKEIYNYLKSYGANVKEIKIYTMNKADSKIGKYMIEKISDLSFDILTFTSSMIVNYFFDFVSIYSNKNSFLNLLNENYIIGAIGSKTKKTLENYGIKNVIIPKDFTFKSLLLSIKKHEEIYNQVKKMKNNKLEMIYSIFFKNRIDAVGIKLLNTNYKKDLSINIEKSNTKLRHCQYVDLVRTQKNMIYTTINEQSCIGGSSALGFLELPENIKSGTFYYNNLKQFKNIDAARKTIESITFLDSNSINKVIYFYFNRENVSILKENMIYPDVLLLFLNPKQTMIVSQCYLYNSGGCIESKFSGRQSFCSDAVARVIKNQIPNITVGCGGSRKYTKIKDEELLLSIPWKDIDRLYEGFSNLL